MYGKLSTPFGKMTKYLFKYLVAGFDLKFLEKSFSLVLFKIDIGTAVFRFNQGIA